MAEETDIVGEDLFAEFKTQPTAEPEAAAPVETDLFAEFRPEPVAEAPVAEDVDLFAEFKEAAPEVAPEPVAPEPAPAAEEDLFAEFRGEEAAPEGPSQETLAFQARQGIPEEEAAPAAVQEQGTINQRFRERRTRARLEAVEAREAGDFERANRAEEEFEELNRTILESGEIQGQANVAAARSEAIDTAFIGVKALESGLTFGLSDVLFRRLEESDAFFKLLGIETAGAVNATTTNQQIIQAVGKMAGTLISGAASAKGIVNPLVARFKNISDAKALLAVRLGTAGLINLTDNASQIANGDKSFAEGLRDAMIGIASAGVGVVPETFVKSGIGNFLSQIATDLAFDISVDAFLTKRLRKDNIKEWMIQELPNLATSIIFAGRDLKDVDFESNRVRIKNEIIDGLKAKIRKGDVKVEPSDDEGLQLKQDLEPVAGERVAEAEVIPATGQPQKVVEETPIVEGGEIEIKPPESVRAEQQRGAEETDAEAFDPDVPRFSQRVAREIPESREGVDALQLKVDHLSNEEAVTQARAMIDADEAFVRDAIRDPKRSQDPIIFTAAQLLIKDTQEAGDIDKVITLTEEFTPKTTNAAQALQKLSLFSLYEPGTMLRHAQREVEKISKAQKAKDATRRKPRKVKEATPVSEDKTKAIPTAIRDAHDKAAQDTNTSEKSKERKRRLGSKVRRAVARISRGKAEDLPVWETYKRGVAEATFSRIDAALDPKATRNKPALQDFTTRLQALVSGRLDLPETARATLTPVEAAKLVITDFRENTGKYKQAVAEAKRFVKDKYKGKPQLLAEVDKVFAGVLDSPLTDSMRSNMVRDALKQMDADIDKIVRENVGVGRETKAKLVDKLVKEVGLKLEDATAFADSVRNEFNIKATKAKRSAFNKILTPKERSQRKSKIRKLIEVSNMASRTEGELRGLAEEAIGKTAAGEIELSKAEQRQIVEFMQDAQEAERLGNSREHDKNIARALAIVANKAPVGIGKKISTVQTMAQLLNLKTVGRNLIGNSIFAGIDNVSKTLQVPIDKLISLQSGKRTAGLPSVRQQLKGWKKGFIDSAEEVGEGINTQPHLQSQFSLEQAQAFANTWASKALGFALRVPDRASYNAEFTDSMRRQMAVQDIEKPTMAIIDNAIYDATYVTFQDNSVAARVLSGFKNLLNLKFLGFDFGVGDLIIKYPFTPANLLQRGIDYSPAGLLRGIAELAAPLYGKELNQYRASLNLARGIVGSNIWGGAFLLARLGIISGAGERDRDVEDLERSQGRGRYRVNTSALKRFVSSGFNAEVVKPQELDVYKTYDWAQPISFAVGGGATLGEPTVRRNMRTGDVLGSVALAVTEASRTLAEQPLLTGLRRVASNEDPVESIGEVLSSAPASFIPTLMGQIALYSDPAIKDARDRSIMNDAKKRIAKKLPYFNQFVPNRRRSTGEEIKVENPTMFNIFVSPAIVTEFHSSPGAQLVNDIYERGFGVERRQFPRIMPDRMTFNNKTVDLDGTQRNRFQQLVGEDTMKRLDKFADQQWVWTASPETVAKTIDTKILSLSKKIAVQQMIKEMGGIKEFNRIANEQDAIRRR